MLKRPNYVTDNYIIFPNLFFKQVRYQTNEEYLRDIPEEGEDEAVSPDAGEGAGIVLEIRPKSTSSPMQQSQASNEPNTSVIDNCSSKNYEKNEETKEQVPAAAV